MYITKYNIQFVCMFIYIKYRFNSYFFRLTYQRTKAFFGKILYILTMYFFLTVSNLSYESIGSSFNYRIHRKYITLKRGSAAKCRGYTLPVSSWIDLDCSLVGTFDVHGYISFIHSLMTLELWESQILYDDKFFIQIHLNFFIWKDFLFLFHINLALL